MATVRGSTDRPRSADRLGQAVIERVAVHQANLRDERYGRLVKCAGMYAFLPRLEDAAHEQAISG